MNVRVRFLTDEDATIENVDSTLTKDGSFMLMDQDGDKLFVCKEHHILYVQFEYE